VADRPAVLFLMVDDAPRSTDPVSVQEAKAVAAAESMCAMLRDRGEDVRFGGVFSARKAGAA